MSSKVVVNFKKKFCKLEIPLEIPLEILYLLVVWGEKLEKQTVKNELLVGCGDLNPAQAHSM